MKNEIEIKRTKNIQMLTYNKILDILQHESKRTLEVEKEDKIFSNFETIIAVLNFFKLPTIFFESLRFEDLREEDIYNRVVKIFDDVADKILENHNNQELKLLLDNLYDYLSESDKPEKGDLIFVFGSKNTFRIETAIRLYKEGFAPKILISGRCPIYEIDKKNKTEAETLAEFAEQNGVLKEDLILEKTAISLPDNVKASLNLLEKINISHRKIILINSPFCQRRGFVHFNKFSKNETSFVRVNSDKTSPKFSKNGWYKDEEGIGVILREFFCLRISGLLNTG